MENVVDVLSLVLKGRDTAVLSEKLSTEEGRSELKAELQTLVIRTPEENNQFVANVQRNYKDKMHGEIVGATMEKNEKEIMKAFGVEFQHGVDFSNQIELVRKIVESKGESKGEPNEAITKLKGELEKVQSAYRTLKDESEVNITNAQKKAQERIANAHLELLISSYKDKVDAEDEAKDAQIDFLKYQFQKNYSVTMDGDNIIVVDKDGNKVTNDVMADKPLSEVVNEVATKSLKFKEVVSIKGRGNDDTNKSQPAGKINFAKYGDDFDAFYENELKGKGLSRGSREVTEYYKQFKTQIAG